MTHLKIVNVDSLYEDIRDPLRHYLRSVDIEVGLEESSTIDSIRKSLELFELRYADGPDEVLNDFFVIHCYVDFFSHYGQVWRLIAEEKFSESWSKLQDALDALRLVRRFSRIDMSALEEQLIELEKTYPYNVFFSIGAVVEKFECSICGQDIDSFQCAHRKGQLYRGRMATGIARNMVSFNHVAIVDEPKDRRCVVTYEDTGDQFKLVRFLSRLLQQRKMVVSDFGNLIFSKRMKPNPDFHRVGRNDPCYCGSGIKFKRCCIAKSRIEGDHVDIAPRPVSPEQAIV